MQIVERLCDRIDRLQVENECLAASCKACSDTLIAAQAHIAELREALETIRSKTNDPLPPYRIMSIECASIVARDALSAPDDLSALDRHDDVLIERCVSYCSSEMVSTSDSPVSAEWVKCAETIGVNLRTLKKGAM